MSMTVASYLPIKALLFDDIINGNLTELRSYFSDKTRNKTCSATREVTKSLNFIIILLDSKDTKNILERGCA